ncbi:hypothetical protein [Kribbella sp. NPDC048928]|uniref:hypothetical protein n=1 Tax=Kribbella sp. NPDC048928 TaxID=3364111 RepID=UPI0037238F20
MSEVARAADPTTFGISPVLYVQDLEGTVRLLCSLLGMQVRFQLGDLAHLGCTIWNGQGGLEVKRTPGPVAPATISVDVGVLVDPLCEAALAAGLSESTAPEDMPWVRRTFTLVLPDGHRLAVSGPVRV